MSRSYLDELRKMAENPHLQSVLPLIGSVLYLADKVNQIQEEKQDKPSVHDEEINDQRISRPSLQRMAIDLITSAGEDRASRIRLYKTFRSLQ